MWPKLCTYSARFVSAVLTGIDAEGYPCSVRCVPMFDDEQQLVQLASIERSTIAPGQANLLFHSHNEQLWDLQIVQVVGSLEQTETEWVFRPERLLGEGEGALQAIRMIVGIRRTAHQYLAKRGLARPQIPWDRIRSFYPEATQPTATQQPKRTAR